MKFSPKMRKLMNKANDKLLECDENSFIHDDDLIDIENAKLLCKKLNFLATRAPNPHYYAEAWLKTIQTDLAISKAIILSDDARNLLPRLPTEVKGILEKYNNWEVLFLSLSKSLNLIEPLILIESGLKNKNIVDKHESVAFISDQKTLLKVLEHEIRTYKAFLEGSQLADNLSNCLMSLNFYESREIDTTKTSNYLSNAEAVAFLEKARLAYIAGITPKKIKVDITRAQYAFLIMVLADLPEKLIPYAVFSCRPYMTGIKKEKRTKILVHTLCCIIYDLLIQHAKHPKQKNKAYCRFLTSRIINSYSPKNMNGEQYYSIDERGVEYALTGK